MVLPDLPTPGVTLGGRANLWRWAVNLNTAITARYQDAINRVGSESNSRVAADTNLQNQINAISGDGAAYFRPETYGAVGDGVTDDTDAFLDCIAAALPVNGAILLGAKTYGISGELQMVGLGTSVTLVGQSPEGSVLKALGPDAAITWGDLPTGPYPAGLTLFGRPGLSHDWSFDGDGVATQGITIGSVIAYSQWQNVQVHKVDGDGWLVCPQNCTFVGCLGYDNAGNGWTFNYGVQQCEFINCHGHGNDGWDFQIKQDGGPFWGASAQPQILRYINCICEQAGSPTFGGTGLGGWHIREGLDVTFERCAIVSNGTEGSLVMTPSTANGFVGRVTVRDCNVIKIYLDAVSGGVAQGMGGANTPLLLEGWTTVTEIVNGSASPIFDNSEGYPALLSYTTEGTGAFGFLLQHHQAKTPDDYLYYGADSTGLPLFIVDKDGNLMARYGTDEQVFLGTVFGSFPGIVIGDDGVLLRSGEQALQTNALAMIAAAADQVPTVTQGFAGQTADLHQYLNSSNVVIAGVEEDGKLITPSLEWQPSHNNLKAANAPPAQMTTQVIGPTGFYFLDRVWIPAGTVITNLHMFVQTAGSGLTYAAAAVYEADGTRSGVTGSQTGVWDSAGHKSMALGSPVAAQSAGRFVWVAHAWAGTTGPTMGLLSFVAGAADAGAISPIANGYIVGASPLPSSLTMGSLTAYVPFWVGVS